MCNEFKKQYEDAMAVKGYGIDYSYLCDESFKEKEKRRKIEEQTKDKLKDISKEAKDFKIEIIESLAQYQKIIEKLPEDPVFPIFYRGQNNANFLLNPSAFRKNPETENILLQEFCRRFPSEINKCHNVMEKLVLMQHYGLHTRCLDITEAPLPALYFACADFKKFTQFSKTNMDKWGEILLFKARNEDQQKYPESNTVSIMANTAFQKNCFNIVNVEINYKQDNHLSALDNFISIKHILRHSIIVRTPQDNPRIRNQKGAFILVNSNYISAIDVEYENGKIDIIEDNKFLNDYILCLDESVTESDFIKTIKNDWNKTNPKKLIQRFDIISYQKAKPYDQSENVPEYIKKDPFDINELFYRNKSKKRIIILIPPYAKGRILEELKHNKITEDFIYPDMDTVSNELNNSIENNY